MDTAFTTTGVQFGPFTAGEPRLGRPAPAQGARRAFGVWLLGALVCAALMTGCGSKGSGAGARLEGAVTLDGNPITEGTLQFIPQQPSKAGPVMAPIKDGRYVADAIPRGKIRVVVSATKKTGKMIKEYSEPYPEVVSIIPAKYRDGIEIDISGDKVEQNFELTSR
jgi:hypothetical protein